MWPVRNLACHPLVVARSRYMRLPQQDRCPFQHICDDRYCKHHAPGQHNHNQNSLSICQSHRIFTSPHSSLISLRKKASFPLPRNSSSMTSEGAKQLLLKVHVLLTSIARQTTNQRSGMGIIVATRLAYYFRIL